MRDVSRARLEIFRTNPLQFVSLLRSVKMTIMGQLLYCCFSLWDNIIPTEHSDEGYPLYKKNEGDQKPPSLNIVFSLLKRLQQLFVRITRKNPKQTEQLFDAPFTAFRLSYKNLLYNRVTFYYIYTAFKSRKH